MATGAVPNFDDFVKVQPSAAIPSFAEFSAGPIAKDRHGNIVPNELPSADEIAGRASLEQFKQNHPLVYGAMKMFFNTAEPMPGIMAIQGPAAAAAESAAEAGTQSASDFVSKFFRHPEILAKMKAIGSAWLNDVPGVKATRETASFGKTALKVVRDITAAPEAPPAPPPPGSMTIQPEARISPVRPPLTGPAASGTRAEAFAQAQPAPVPVATPAPVAVPAPQQFPVGRAAEALRARMTPVEAAKLPAPTPVTPAQGTPAAAPNSITSPDAMPRTMITQDDLAQKAADLGLPLDDVEEQLRGQGFRVMERRELNTTLHAIVPDHETLSAIAKKSFNVPSMTKLTDNQMLELVNRLKTEQVGSAPATRAQAFAAQAAPSDLETQLGASVAKARAGKH